MNAAWTWRHFTQVAFVRRLCLWQIAESRLRLFYCLENLRAGWANHVLEVKARLDELSYCSFLRVKIITGSKSHLLHIEVEDLLFDHLRVFPLERITLFEQEVDAASQCPNVNLFTKAAFLQDKLRGRVIDMTAEVASSEQLLEIVWQAYSVELNDSACKLLDSARVNIPVHIVLGVQVSKSFDNLAENAEQLVSI